MKQAWSDLKSFVTVAMTVGMILLLFVPIEVNKEVLMLFSTAFGSIITFFFTKDKKDSTSENIKNEEEK